MVGTKDPRPSIVAVNQIVKKAADATRDAEARLARIPGIALPDANHFDEYWREGPVAFARAAQLLTWAVDELEKTAKSSPVKAKKGNRNAT